MGSHFDRSTTRRRSPSYCIKGMWFGIAPTIDDRPISVNAYVKWFDSIGTDFLDFTETLHAVRNDTHDGYIAWSSETHPRIGLSIDDKTELNRYEVSVLVDLWGWIEYEYCFEDVEITFRPPWGSSLHQKVWIHNEQFIQIRLLA